MCRSSRSLGGRVDRPLSAEGASLGSVRQVCVLRQCFCASSGKTNRKRSEPHRKCRIAHTPCVQCRGIALRLGTYRAEHLLRGYSSWRDKKTQPVDVVGVPQRHAQEGCTGVGEHPRYAPLMLHLWRFPRDGSTRQRALSPYTSSPASNRTTASGVPPSGETRIRPMSL